MSWSRRRFLQAAGLTTAGGLFLPSLLTVWQDLQAPKAFSPAARSAVWRRAAMGATSSAGPAEAASASSTE